MQIGRDIIMLFFASSPFGLTVLFVFFLGHSGFGAQGWVLWQFWN